MVGFTSLFEWLNGIPCVCVCVCIHHIFRIHSSFNGQLGCFHDSAIFNNAAVNMGAQIPFRDSDFLYFGYIYKWVGKVLDL